MTPLECAQGIAEFLRGKIVDYEELVESTDGEEKENYNVYAGFLPYAANRQEQKKLCPAIVVRPLEVNDKKDDSTVLLGIYVTTYDEHKEIGCYGLYHLLEFVRFHLLACNPAAGKYFIEPGSMTTSVPDEQPFPQWWGRIDFSVYLEQPENSYIKPMNKWKEWKK